MNSTELEVSVDDAKSEYYNLEHNTIKNWSKNDGIEIDVFETQNNLNNGFTGETLIDEFYDNVDSRNIANEIRKPISSEISHEELSDNIISTPKPEGKKGLKNFLMGRCKSITSFKNLLNTSNFKRNSSNRSSISSLPDINTGTNMVVGEADIATKSIFKRYSTIGVRPNKSRRISFGGVTRHCPPSSLSIIESKCEDCNYSSGLNDEEYCQLSKEDGDSGVSRDTKIRRFLSPNETSDEIHFPEKISLQGNFNSDDHFFKEPFVEKHQMQSDKIQNSSSIVSIPNQPFAESSSAASLASSDEERTQEVSTYFGEDATSEVSEMVSSQYPCSGSASQDYLTSLQLDIMEMLQSLENEEQNWFKNM